MAARSHPYRRPGRPISDGLDEKEIETASGLPDPAYLAELHLDRRFGGFGRTLLSGGEQLGGVRLPKLADVEIFADSAGRPFCL